MARDRADRPPLAGDQDVEEFLDDFLSERSTAIEQGQGVCPGTFDAHLDLWDEACPYCHAIL